VGRFFRSYVGIEYLHANIIRVVREISLPKVVKYMLDFKIEKEGSTVWSEIAERA
jgi:hypothetical protein